MSKQAKPAVVQVLAGQGDCGACGLRIDLVRFVFTKSGRRLPRVCGPHKIKHPETGRFVICVGFGQRLFTDATPEPNGQNENTINPT